jgi:hypothetical protein
MAAKEQLESVQGHLPAAQVRWLKSKAELRGRSVSAELKSLVHLAMTLEGLMGPTDVTYAVAPMPTEAA